MKRFNIGNKYTYCPNGNYWVDISGIFDERIYLFCDCAKCAGQIYELRPVKFKSKNPETINELVAEQRKWQKLENIRDSINFKNMDLVDEMLNPDKK